LQKNPKKNSKIQNTKNLPLQEDFCYKHTASAASSHYSSSGPAIHPPRRYLRQVAWARHTTDQGPHWIEESLVIFPLALVSFWASGFFATSSFVLLLRFDNPLTATLP
jgi:hypothetical protein